MSKKVKFWLIGSASVFLLALVTALLFVFGAFQTAQPANAPVVSDGVVSNLADESNSSAEALPEDTVIKPEKMSGVFVDSPAQEKIDAAVDWAVENGLNTIVLTLHQDDGNVVFQNQSLNYEQDLLQYAIDQAHEKSILVVGLLDVSFAVNDSEVVPTLLQAARDLAGYQGLDGILIDGYTAPVQRNEQIDLLAQYMGHANFERAVRTALMQAVCDAIKSETPRLYLGLACEAVWADQKTDPAGVPLADSNGVYSSFSNGYSDTYGWLKAGLFDFAVVRADRSTADEVFPFEDMLAWWEQALEGKADLTLALQGGLVGQNSSGWRNPDQLTRQLRILAEHPKTGFFFAGFETMLQDKSGSTNAVIKQLKGQLPSSYVLKDLTFTSPSDFNFTTTQSYVNIIGASDPEFPLTLNGAAVERNELGYFNCHLTLQVGKNTFTFAHKGTEKTFTVNYRYIVLKDIYPSGNLTLDSGATLVVNATARAGSSVTASLNGTTIQLTEIGSQNDDSDANETDETFSTFVGKFTMPSQNRTINLGRVSVSATSNGITERLTSGNITVRQVTAGGGAAATPSGGNYINVGSGLIAEVVVPQIETFDPDTTDDWSRPTNNYLPAGTVDYCSASPLVIAKTDYRVLRYGKRLPVETKSGTNLKIYEGTLPSTNTVSLDSVDISERYTTLRFDVEWKAPFLFDLLPQSYTNPSTQDYTVSSVTYSYIDITFCYATVYEGSPEISADHPVFSRAEVIKNQSDYTLRLHLKKRGAFYGWSAEYDAQGRLVFRFLHPAKLKPANNAYGYSLEGITILVDAGHGGYDKGALGSNPAWTESTLNLLLAKKLQSRLTALGANVVMTRTDETTLESADRTQRVRDANADLMISIHRNASNASSPRGFSSYHFNAFSKNAAQKIYNATMGSDLYEPSRWSGVHWHYFYLCRVTDCPTVLTENGFMTNGSEYATLIQDSFNEECADALVRGILDYFISIQ